MTIGAFIWTRLLLSGAPFAASSIDGGSSMSRIDAPRTFPRTFCEPSIGPRKTFPANDDGGSRRRRHYYFPCLRPPALATIV